MTKKVEIPECKHPMETAEKIAREDGSGVVDLVCGVCGFPMCEIANSAEDDGRSICGNTACGDYCATENNGCSEYDNARECKEFAAAPAEEVQPATDAAKCGNTRCSMHDKDFTGNCRAIADMMETRSEEMDPRGCQDYKPLHQSQTFPPETFSETMDEHPDGLTVCGHTACVKFRPDEPNHCEAFEHVSECLNARPVEEETHAADEEEAETEGTEEGLENAGDDVGDGAAEPGSWIDKLNVEPITIPYVTRDPDKVGGRFQELLPCPVDDHELADLGAQMAEKHSLWLKTKLDAKKFAKACKEVTDRCEEEMEELGLIIQDQAKMNPVDVQWEYDFTAGTKKLRRCDTWKIVREETLSVEERQGTFDFQASTAAVEQLREVQGVTGPEQKVNLCGTCTKELPPCDGNPTFGCDDGGSPKDDNVTRCDGYVKTSAAEGPPCEACGGPVTDGENVGEDCNLHPRCVEGGLCRICVSPYDCSTTEDDVSNMVDCLAFASELTDEQIAHRDKICGIEGWRACSFNSKCFTPCNEEEGICFDEEYKTANPYECSVEGCTERFPNKTVLVQHLRAAHDMSITDASEAGRQSRKESHTENRDSIIQRAIEAGDDINEFGVFNDYHQIIVPLPKGFSATISVAVNSDGGYHTGYDFKAANGGTFTQGGASGAPSVTGSVYKTVREAVAAEVKHLQEYLRNVDGAKRKAVDKAIAEFSAKIPEHLEG